MEKFFQRSVLRNDVYDSGFASAMIESRVIEPDFPAALAAASNAAAAPGARLWHASPSAPVPTTSAPATVVLTHVYFMLPQMYVGRVPWAIRLRPYDEPNEPPTANAGTSS